MSKAGGTDGRPACSLRVKRGGHGESVASNVGGSPQAAAGAVVAHRGALCRQQPMRAGVTHRATMCATAARCMQGAAGGAAKRGERSGASVLLRHTARASCPLTIFAAVVGAVTETGGVLARLHIRRGAVMDRDASDAGDTPQAAAGAAVAHRAALCVSSPHGRARRSGRRLCATAAPGWTAEAVPAFE